MDSNKQTGSFRMPHAHDAWKPSVYWRLELHAVEVMGPQDKSCCSFSHQPKNPNPDRATPTIIAGLTTAVAAMLISTASRLQTVKVKHYGNMMLQKGLIWATPLST